MRPDSHDFQVDYKFLFKVADLPWAPRPTQVWGYNAVKLEALDSSCEWKTFAREQFDPFDIAETPNVDGNLVIEDVSANDTIGQSRFCFIRIMTYKLLGFNAVAQGQNLSWPWPLPPGQTSAFPINNEQAWWLLNHIRPPLAFHIEAYYGLFKKNCSCQCLRLVEKWLPDSIECVSSPGLFKCGRGLYVGNWPITEL